MKMEPDQGDWDLHLCRIWYANKHATIGEAEKWFFEAWGKWPIAEGFTRTSLAKKIAVWRFFESMPKADKVLKKYSEARVEDVARAITKANLSSTEKATTKMRKSCDVYALSKDRRTISASQIQADIANSHNRGNQWKVCK